MEKQFNFFDLNSTLVGDTHRANAFTIYISAILGIELDEAIEVQGYVENCYNIDYMELGFSQLKKELLSAYADLL